MTKIRAFIFDLDGVIVDTAKYHYIAWKHLAKQLGFDFTPEHNEKLKGVSRMESLNILLSIGGIALPNDQKDKLAAQKNALYVSYIKKMTPSEILPGVLHFLGEIKKTGIKSAIGSASKNTPLILKQLNIEKFFDAVVDGNSVTHAKPNPEVFLQGAQLLGVNASECLVFEDAIAGIEAAGNAKMHCIGIGDYKILNNARVVIPGFQNFSLQKLTDLVPDLKIKGIK